jgi:hypothetical protein
MTHKYPTYSYVQIAGQLQLENVSVSPGGVRKTRGRQGLVRKFSSYLWLEREVWTYPEKMDSWLMRHEAFRTGRVT